MSTNESGFSDALFPQTSSKLNLGNVQLHGPTPLQTLKQLTLKSPLTSNTFEMRQLSSRSNQNSALPIPWVAPPLMQHLSSVTKPRKRWSSHGWLRLTANFLDHLCGRCLAWVWLLQMGACVLKPSTWNPVTSTSQPPCNLPCMSQLLGMTVHLRQISQASMIRFAISPLGTANRKPTLRWHLHLSAA